MNSLRLFLVTLATYAIGMCHDSANAQTPSLTIAFYAQNQTTISSGEMVTLTLKINAGASSANQQFNGSVTIVCSGNSKTTTFSGTYDANGNYDGMIDATAPTFNNNGTATVKATVPIRSTPYDPNTLDASASP